MKQTATARVRELHVSVGTSRDISDPFGTLVQPMANEMMIRRLRSLSSLLQNTVAVGISGFDSGYRGRNVPIYVPSG
jgi:hypothetical protein